MNTPLLICLVSPQHLGSNPRLVKEADALAEAGYRVKVIYGETHVGGLDGDKSILSAANWTAESVSLISNPRRTLAWKVAYHAAVRLIRLGVQNVEIAKRASHPLFPALRRAARATQADLYHGHCLAALPVVVDAARHRQVRCGFDAEDFHSHESRAVGRGAVANVLAGILERRYLKECDFHTAASPLIADAYRQTYRIDPTPILNVFPLSEAVEPVTPPAIPRFYWFSQTVGNDRGIEEFIDILVRLNRSVGLDLRGKISAHYRQFLEHRVNGTRVTLRILEPDLPAQCPP